MRRSYPLRAPAKPRRAGASMWVAGPLLAAALQGCGHPAAAPVVHERPLPRIAAGGLASLGPFKLQPDGAAVAPLPSDVLFSLDSAVLVPNARKVLGALVGPAKAHPGRVVVTGSTDGLGTAAHNLDLSRARAVSVATFLRQAGVAGSHLETIGVGEAGAVDNVANPARRAVTVTLT